MSAVPSERLSLLLLLAIGAAMVGSLTAATAAAPARETPPTKPAHAVVPERLTGIPVSQLLVSMPAGARVPEAQLRRDVWLLAHPDWEGRGIGTAGIDSAANYLALRMRAIGLAPGGDDGTYFQSLEVTTGVEVGEPCAIEIAGNRFAAGEDFEPIGFSTNGRLKAPLVFAGYGISAPGYQYDDYAGLDVRDKLVLVLTNEPGEMDSTSRFDGSVNTAHAELRTKAIVAREHGALGLLVVNGPRHHAGEPLRAPRRDGAGYMTSGLLAASVSERLAERMLAGSGHTLRELQDSIERDTRPASVALADSATVMVTLRRTRATTRNVVGVIAGRDSARTLVVGAHYDHLGFGGESSLAADSHAPHVGADDNASGTAAMLGVATQLAARAAARTPQHHLVFCAFTGEEIGLLGSGHFVDQPTRPLPTVETMINMDMVGRLSRNRLAVSGTGTAAEFPAMLAAVNASTGGFEIKSSEDGYGPSDHSSFYKRRLPVLFLFTGAHVDYHKPSDTPDKLEYAGLARITQFCAAVVESLDARPRPTFHQARSDSTIGRIAGGAGYGAYLGTIPDYMQTEGGVLLSGVRSGGPAEQAGLRGADTIIQFDGVHVDNIYDYTYALRSRKPGQQVRITVKREGGNMDFVVTLGRRP
ncbi:MAG: M28 family peptidase [Candidatus Eisenbacteria bacterium]|uniref:M28 family peptidase n=1 Tax=Eiseniibacteriota bacterium TaxID=2212470 RepID=A0A849SL52_UNCEI|nr:M28 family peptidase [Candidatus Eisenbacteria bacterium]